MPPTTSLEAIGLNQCRLPAVPSLEDMELEGWTMTDDAMLQQYADQQSIKNVLTGADNRYVFMAGPCAVDNNSLEVQSGDGPLYDAVVFQDALRAELRRATGNDPQRLALIMAATAALLERAGFRKPRSKGGSAGILASDPVHAKVIATEMANNGAEDPDIKMSLATELADPQDLEMQSLFSMLWSGARHNKMTTLRHSASAPILVQHSLNLLYMLQNPRIDLADARTAAKTNPVLYNLFTDVEEHGLSDGESRAALIHGIVDYHRKPFLFKIGEDNDITTAFDSQTVAASPQQNTFTAKDGRQRGPLWTVGNESTGILFRGGVELTPEALRNDLRLVQQQVDARQQQTKKHIAWGADYSHRTALQCTGGKRSEIGQIMAHQIVLEEIKAGNIQPQIFMMESTIYPGHKEQKEWGYSTIDRTVSAQTAAKMIVELATLLVSTQ